MYNHLFFVLFVHVHFSYLLLLTIDSLTNKSGVKQMNNLFRALNMFCVFMLTTSVSVLAAPIHEAAKSGDMREIDRILVQRPDQFNAKDKWGWTPLMYAVRGGRLDIVQSLLSRGARVSLTDKTMGDNALDMVRMYLRQCEDQYLEKQIAFWNLQKASNEVISKRRAEHKKHFGSAQREVWIKIEKLLSEAYKKERAVDKASPLMKAVEQGDTKKVEQFLAQASHVNMEIKDDQGRTPLLLAVEHGKMDIVKVLLDKGAEMGSPDNNGKTAYSRAKEMFKLFETARNARDYQLLKKALETDKIKINAKDENGETALMRAVAKGKLEEVKKLLRLGASTKEKNCKGESLQDVACTRYHSSQLKDEVLKLIKQHQDAK